MKSNRVYKRAFNEALDYLSTLRLGEALPSESALGTQLQVSRTTVRKVLSALEDRAVVAVMDGERRLVTSDFAQLQFPQTETVPMSTQVEKQFLEWMLRGNASPGTTFSELELARRFGVATTGVREFLFRFSHYGLIEKRPNGGWLFKGFTTDFALELFEIREMFELRSARAFAGLPERSPLWWQLDAVRIAHMGLLKDIDERFHDFSDLDNRFHRLVNSASPNRFIDDFYDIISIIFHYHYQWNKQDERTRNQIALREHLDYIAALQSHDERAVEQACRAHLTSARKTLIRATLG